MYTRIKELLEQVLLEFDPKKIEKQQRTNDPGFHGSKTQRASSMRTRAETGEIDRADQAFSRKKNKSKADLPFIKSKKIKKAGRRALARGGEGDIEKTLR